MDKEYQQTIKWMEKQLPMYQKVGKVAFNASLDNILILDKHLGQPHQKFDTLHIAGTNGKGSTSHMLASILQEAGYKTGLYTSPHLKDYRERIRINGKKIDKKSVVNFIKNNAELLHKHHFSFFEMSVGMAFDYFANENIDIAIIETGLGGRLDSTNIIQPILSIITNIGKDHVGILGDSLSAIAEEKAGIIKNNTPVVIGESTAETITVFRNIAKKKKAKLILVDQEQQVPYDIALKGNYQIRNTRTVLEAIKVLRDDTSFKISDSAISKGLLSVIKNTGLMGRWQVLSEQPLTVCDTAHNPHALKLVLQQIKEQKYTKLHIVLGMMADKEIEEIISLFPKEAYYYFCAPKNNRALDLEKLKNISTQFGLEGETFSSVSEAYHAAIEASTKTDMIFIGGSNFVVAEVL